jgi:glyoxylase-like metal-dependent hydrolase (beta-lactamase superfamily II)
MPRWLRNTALVLAALAALAFGTFRWLTAREEVPAKSDYALDLDELRRLAEALPGAKPVRVRSELVAEGALPRGALFAGESLREPHPMVHQVFQVVFPDSFLLIDAGFDRAMHARMGNAELPFRDEGYAQVQRALGRAAQILITHEHADHIGGAARHDPPEALAPRLRLTREQLGSRERLDEIAFPEALRAALAPLEYSRTLAVAPGVVVQKAPGHTPGSQLVYVRREDGAEYLFLGDVAWHLDQIRNLHYRPRLVTDFFLGEDRAAVLAEFRALDDFARAHPEVELVVSHDADQRAALLASGKLLDGLELSGEREG